MNWRASWPLSRRWWTRSWSGSRLDVIHTRPTFEPAKADYSSETRRLQFASDCVVAVAVICERVSVRPSAC